MATDAPPDDQARDELEFVRQWLEAIELSEKEEKDWRDTADRACDAYRGGKDEALGTFNIFHSNVETLVPAVYNSTPVPDVRRRFNDEDPVAKDVSELFERSLSYQIDAYDFDQTVLSCVRDMAITSRGIARVRYVPYIADDVVADEDVTCEYVQWRSFRRGPAKIWSDVPWIAFDTYLSYSEVEKLVEDEKDKDTILKELKFSYSAEPKKQAEQQAENLSKLAARARVWEIWDRDNRQVHFISPDYTQTRLTSIEDPLELRDFWPIPRPLSAIIAPDSLVPITLLQIYERLLEELNTVQRRILRLTNQLRARGWYAGLDAADIKAGAEADDGELIPLSGAETFVTQGTGLDKAIQYWPLDTISKTLTQLVEQREAIKSTIYEVTGLSDIVRGASNPNETATAQNLKSQWGSLRIQKMQAEVARFVRDIFRLKAEVMANKFSMEKFETMTGLKFPSNEEKQIAQQQAMLAQQAGQQPDPKLLELLSKPSREDIEKLLRSDALRSYRVDIESDSTVRGDLQKNQEQMSLFLSGTAQYLSAVGPLVQAGAMPQDLAIEIYAGFARSFRLGKQAEDALDRLADQAKRNPGQKPPSEAEIKMQVEQQKLELEKKRMAMDLMKQREEMALKREEMQMKMQLEQQKAAQDMQIKSAEAQQDMQIEGVKAQNQMQVEGMKAAQQQEIAKQTGETKIEMMRRQQAAKPKKAANG